LWIITNVLDWASMWSSLGADTSERRIAGVVVNLVGLLASILLCLVAIRMVREIYRMQSEWAAQPIACTCAICHQPIPQSDMIILNNAWVCARCKPILLQKMREGATGG
jgi:hypothetical protein